MTVKRRQKLATVELRYRGGDQAHRMPAPTTGRGEVVDGIYLQRGVPDAPNRKPTPLPKILRGGR